MSSAEAIAHAFSAAVDAELPGLLSRVHLTGSAGTDDWRAGRSDVDLVFLLGRELVEGDIRVLRRLHADSTASCTVDGIYLTAGQLATGPDAVTRAPQSVDGVFTVDLPGAQLTWVTWLEVEAGRTLDGGAVIPLFPDTAERAARSSRHNLRDYWLRLGRRAGIQSRFLPRGARVPASSVAWVALGPPRLVMTIEDGVVASKTQAGRFAAQQWPQFASLLGRVIEYRATGTGAFTNADAREALALLRACVDRGTRYS